MNIISLQIKTILFHLVFIIVFNPSTLTFSADKTNKQRQSVLPCDNSLKVRTKVVGGRPAALAKWPWIASLQFFDDEDKDKVTLASCGGTVISENWILTAAHCLRDLDNKTFSRSFIGQEYFGNMQVIIGLADLRATKKENIYPIEKIIIHPEYIKAENIYKLEQEDYESKKEQVKKTLSPPLSPSKTVGYDIALIKLKRSWKGDIARISFDRKYDTDGTYQARVAGFGAVELKRTKNSIDPVLRKYQLAEDHTLFAGCARLMEAILPTVTLQECNQRWKSSHKKRPKIDQSNICAGFTSPSKDSCIGDSGSALVTEDKNGNLYQIGIVSWGTRNCAGHEKSYGVYTRVSHYANWIMTTLAENEVDLKANAKSILKIQKIDIKQPTNQIPELVLDLRRVLAPVNGNVRATIKESPIIKVDQIFKFEIESNITGKLVLIDIAPGNSISQIFPNEYTANDEQMKIVSGSIFNLPNKKNLTNIEFSGQRPIGKGKVIALVVPKDFPVDLTLLKEVNRQKTKGLSTIDTPLDYVINLVMEVYDEVRQLDEVGSDLSKKWAYGEINYEVIE